MPPAKAAKAAQALAGLLTYSPGPGLYSRMERAVQQMPKVIRTQELPGLLRKYKDGVPGWEVRAVAPALEGVQSISRQDLLDLIQQHSPAYTHREIVLGGRPQMGSPLFDVPEYQGSASRIGEGRGHGMTRYGDYGQGGQDYSELLLLQPGAKGIEFGSHWGGHPQVPGTNQAVAHARYDTHGDALRINELQSDLGINNRKMREAAAGEELNLGRMSIYPFPLEDAWADILIKRLALEAARQGHRAIEVASPRAIADKVGGSIDNYEHFYGKVVPGAIERLGRKMGGLIEDTAAAVDPKVLSLAESEQALARGMQAQTDAQRLYVQALKDRIPGIDIPRPGNSEAYVGHISRPLVDVAEPPVGDQLRYAESLRDSIASLHNAQTGRSLSEGVEFANSLMPKMMRQADELRAGRAWDNATGSMYRNLDQRAWFERPPRRYIMSDEMRKRILRDGIGMSVMGAAATDPDAVLERLQEQE